MKVLSRFLPLVAAAICYPIGGLGLSTAAWIVLAVIFSLLEPSQKEEIEIDAKENLD